MAVFTSGSTTDIEEELIGIILNEPDAYFEIAEKVRPEHFRSRDMRNLFIAIQKVHEGGSEFSFSLVQDRLGAVPSGIMPELWLPSLAAAAPFGIPAEDRADMIRKRFKRARARDHIVPAIAKIAADEELDGDEIPIRLSQTIEDAFAEETPETTATARDTAIRARKRREQSRSAEGGFMTGCDPIDHLMGPFYPGGVTIVGGATSSGKSALLQQVACAAASHGIPTLFHTNEMSKEEAYDRMVAQLARVSTQAMSAGTLNAAEDDRVGHAEYEIDRLPLYFDDAEKPKISRLRLTVQRMKRKFGIRLAIFDHLQFIQTGKRGQKPYEVLEEVTAELKATAKRTGVHFMVVSHLSREATKIEVRTAKDIMRPRMADLHGSSTIEKDADNVMMVHRPAYFLERNPLPRDNKDHAQWQIDVQRWRGKAELLKLKKRGGKGWGVNEVNFYEDWTLFEEIPQPDTDDLLSFEDYRMK